MRLKEVLHNTLAIQTHSGETAAMQKYLKRFARKHGISFTEDRGNIYMTKGEAEIYPCIVAHTDTVHNLIDNFKVLFVEGVYFGWDADQREFAGVGGDDKVGIAIALKMLLDYDIMKAAFFVDEEIGCVGSHRAQMDFFEDCSVVIQCDRRGDSDVVNQVYGETLFGQEFEDAITPIVTKHGRKITTGMLTDVYTLRKKGMNTASMNLSTGYYKPHTSEEYVIYSDVENTLEFVKEVVNELGHRSWPFPRQIRSTNALSNVVQWPPKVPKVLWSDDEEEEEDTDEDFDIDELIRQQMEGYNSKDGILVKHSDLSQGTDLCPNCQENSLVLDDSLDLWYCMTCCDYLIIVDEEGEIIDAYV